MATSMHVFAHHAHVFPASVNANGTIDRLLSLLDACEIDEAVCFAPFPHQVKGMGLDPVEWLAKEVARRGRLHGFGTLDLRRENTLLPIADQVRRIRDFGMRGIKMHPNAQEFDLLSPEAFEAYAAAQKHGLFVTFHSGVHHYRIKHYNVLKFDEVAEHFTELRFSLEHLGGYHFFPEALAVIVNRIPFPPVPNKQCLVYGGLTSVFTPHYNRYWYLPRERLLEAVLQATPDQLIFGLDFPYNLEDNTRMGLQTLRGLGLEPHQLAKILGGNLREALGLPPVQAAVQHKQLQPVAPH
jgi:predicted TIM-barrel fold metal-dependent hydrolase